MTELMKISSAYDVSVWGGKAYQEKIKSLQTQFRNYLTNTNSAGPVVGEAKEGDSDDNQKKLDAWLVYLYAIVMIRIQHNVLHRSNRAMSQVVQPALEQLSRQFRDPMDKLKIDLAKKDLLDGGLVSNQQFKTPVMTKAKALVDEFNQDNSLSESDFAVADAADSPRYEDRKALLNALDPISKSEYGPTWSLLCCFHPHKSLIAGKISEIKNEISDFTSDPSKPRDQLIKKIILFLYQIKNIKENSGKNKGTLESGLIEPVVNNLKKLVEGVDKWNGVMDFVKNDLTADRMYSDLSSFTNNTSSLFAGNTDDRKNLIEHQKITKALTEGLAAFKQQNKRLWWHDNQSTINSLVSAIKTFRESGIGNYEASKQTLWKTVFELRVDMAIEYTGSITEVVGGNMRGAHEQTYSTYRLEKESSFEKTVIKEIKGLTQTNELGDADLVSPGVYFDSHVVGALEPLPQDLTEVDESRNVAEEYIERHYPDPASNESTSRFGPY